jgi:hypothetical protein
MYLQSLLMICLQCYGHTIHAFEVIQAVFALKDEVVGAFSARAFSVGAAFSQHLSSHCTHAPTI